MTDFVIGYGILAAGTFIWCWVGYGLYGGNLADPADAWTHTCKSIVAAGFWPASWAYGLGLALRARREAAARKILQEAFEASVRKAEAARGVEALASSDRVVVMDVPGAAVPHRVDDGIGTGRNR